MSEPAVETPYQPRKRLFFSLLSLAGLLVVGWAFLLWWVPSVGLVNLHPLLPSLLGAIVVSVTATVLGGLALLLVTLLSGRDLFFSQRLRGVVIRYLFPAIIAFGRLLGVERDTLRQSFIALNNQLVRTRRLRVHPGQVLILLPHCVQCFDCDIKLTGDVDRCRRCGRCDISPLADLATTRGVGIAVATGGTLARRIIVERRPLLIIAVACERDLTTGIRDAYPLPVLGILNRRPHGPCLNTTVLLDEVRHALDTHLLPNAT